MSTLKLVSHKHRLKYNKLKDKVQKSADMNLCNYNFADVVTHPDSGDIQILCRSVAADSQTELHCSCKQT